MLDKVRVKMKRYVKAAVAGETYVCDTSQDHSLNNHTLYAFVRNIADKLDIGDSLTIWAYDVPYIAPGGGGDPTGHDLSLELLITAKFRYGNGFTTIYPEYDHTDGIRRKLMDGTTRHWRDIVDGALFLVSRPQYTITVERGKYKNLLGDSVV